MLENTGFEYGDFTNWIGYTGSEINMMILNRWENEVFATNDPNVFRGRNQGKNQVAEGVYFYSLEYQPSCNSEVQTVHGNITVTR